VISPVIVKVSQIDTYSTSDGLTPASASARGPEFTGDGTFG
jgi:hypothetical protein